MLGSTIQSLSDTEIKLVMYLQGLGLSAQEVANFINTLRKLLNLNAKEVAEWVLKRELKSQRSIADFIKSLEQLDERKINLNLFLNQNLGPIPSEEDANPGSLPTPPGG